MDNLAVCLYSLERPAEAMEYGGYGEILGFENQPRAGSGGAHQQFDPNEMKRLEKSCYTQGRHEGSLNLADTREGES